jgi:hypothetical protein
MAMSHDERAALIEQYARGPERIREALARVPKEALAWRPEAGKWSVHEVVVHCADSETNAALRIRTLIAEKEPLVVGYDQDAWARVFDYHSQPLDEGLLRRLTDAEWSKEGRHTESGRYTAEDWLRIYAAHLEGHARQIDRNVEAWTASSSSR